MSVHPPPGRGPSFPQTAEVVQPATILIVEDNILSAKKLAMTVGALGYRVEIAQDGKAALDLIRRTPFDLVLLDIVMPEMDGFHVLEALRDDAELSDLPVIVISSLQSEAESVARALEMGAEDVLPKSYELTILKARLDSALLKKRFRDRELEYLRDVESLAAAARVIEAGAFRPADLDIARVAARSDQLGRFARMFAQMTRVIYERERLKDLRKRTLWGAIMVFIAGTLFATGPSLARIASELGSLPLQTALWTNVVAAITCLGVSLRVYGAPRIRARHLRFCVIWALIYGCTYQVWLDVVATHVEASMIALVGSSRAFMVFALAALISLEKPTARRVIGLGSGMAAVAFVLAAEGALGGNASTPWLLATLGLPALLALHTLLMAWRPKELDAFATTGLMLVIASTLIAVAMALSDQPFLPEAAGGQLVLVILCRGAAGGLAISLAIEIVARAGAVFASQLAYVQTLAGIACGMILLDEQLPAAAWGALILIIFGFLLVQPRRAGDEFSVSIPIDRPTGHPPA